MSVGSDSLHPGGTKGNPFAGDVDGFSVVDPGSDSASTLDADDIPAFVDSSASDFGSVFKHGDLPGSNAVSSGRNELVAHLCNISADGGSVCVGQDKPAGSVYKIYSKRVFVFSALTAVLSGYYIGYLLFGSSSLEVLLSLKRSKDQLIEDVGVAKEYNAELHRRFLELQALEPQ